MKRRMGPAVWFCLGVVFLMATKGVEAQRGMYREWLIISGDPEWRAVSSGLPVSGIVTTRQQGSVWGALLPDSPALWMYADSFDTGPVTSPERSTTRRFVRYLSSAFPKDHLQSATLRITADNGFILYVGGLKVGQTYFPENRYSTDPVYSTDWRNVSTYNVLSALKGVVREIVVDVGDYGGKASLLMELYMVFDTEVWIAEGIPVR